MLAPLSDVEVPVEDDCQYHVLLVAGVPEAVNVIVPAVRFPFDIVPGCVAEQVEEAA